MLKKKIIVAGGGLAGLSAAWHLQQAGQEVLLFEKAPELGGLCRSKTVSGFTFDHGGHFLHFRHSSALDLVCGLLSEDLVRHKKSSWIYSHGTYTPYPFQANLYGLPLKVIRECLAGFMQASTRSSPARDGNFLQWINRKFGPGIARHFMVPYNTKFWTVPPHDLTCGWLDDFIPLPSLERVIEGAAKEKREPLGYNAHFWYPRRGGIGQLAQGLGRLVRNVVTDCAVTGIDLKRKEVRTSRGGRENYDALVYTLPLPELPRLASGLPRAVVANVKKLRWNSIFNLNLGIDRPLGHGRHWVYFPERSPVFFRTGFYSNISAALAPAGRGGLYIEVAYSKEKPISKKSIVSRIEKDLRKSGVLPDGARILCRDMNDTKYGYPIYDRNYDHARGVIIKYLQKNNVLACGRYGAWRYFSMEDALLDGKRAARML